MDEIVLATDAITKSFNGFTAVEDVSLSVRRGTIHALIGPNGAGKTTCFNLLTKFLTPTSGRIYYRARKLPHSARCRSLEAAWRARSRYRRYFPILHAGRMCVSQYSASAMTALRSGDPIAFFPSLMTRSMP